MKSSVKILFSSLPPNFRDIDSARQSERGIENNLVIITSPREGRIRNRRVYTRRCPTAP